jgi:hypothetical protein
LFVINAYNAGVGAANKAAILSGISTLERVSDTVIVITPGSGLVEATQDSGFIELTSGAFLQDLSAALGLTPTFTHVQSSIVTSGVALTVDVDAVGFAVTIARGTFRTVAQGFAPSQIVITGSGATAATLAIANSNASAIQAALNNGQYSITTSETKLEIVGFGPLNIDANSIVVTISRAAILQGALDTTANVLAITNLATS